MKKWIVVLLLLILFGAASFAGEKNFKARIEGGFNFFGYFSSTLMSSPLLQTNFGIHYKMDSFLLGLAYSHNPTIFGLSQYGDLVFAYYLGENSGFTITPEVSLGFGRVLEFGKFGNLFRSNASIKGQVKTALGYRISDFELSLAAVFGVAYLFNNTYTFNLNPNVSVSYWF